MEVPVAGCLADPEAVLPQPTEKRKTPAEAGAFSCGQAEDTQLTVTVPCIQSWRVH